MAISVADIITAFGAHYIAGGQNVKDLLTKFYQKSETEKLFVVIPTTDTVLRKGKATTGKVLQAFQKQFTPYGDTAFAGRQIDLHPLKVDVAEYPDELTRTWAGFLTGDQIDRTKWPFVKWWLEEQVLPQMVEDWELDAIFNGKRAAVVPGTPLPAGQAVNGIRQLINYEINTSGYCDPFILGTFPTDPIEVVEYVEKFGKLIPKKYHTALQPVAMSDTNFGLFREGMAIKYNSNYEQAPLLNIRHTKLTVEGFTSHEGSPKMWTTVKGNAVIGVRKPKNQTVFEVEKEDRKVKAFTDFDKGPGYWDPTLIFTNDQDLAA